MPSMFDLMEPRIHYAHSADQTSIAYWTVGDGPPLVYLAGGPWSHIELWQVPECRRWYERLAQDRMLVRYDLRGTRLSERNVADFSLDTLVGDLEAVVDRLSLGRFALFGAADAGPVALAYAARHPDRVSRLVLWCAWVRPADISSPSVRAWLSLSDYNWDLMTEMCAHLALGWSGGEVGRQAAQRLREVVTPEVMQAALAALERVDVLDLLPRVQAPTLVLHRRNLPWLPVDVASRLASRLPNARLTVFPGEATAPYLGDAAELARMIEEFLDEEEEVVPSDGPPPRVPILGSRPGLSHPNGLTEREIEVLRLIASGQTNSEIADELTLSVRTVERHIGNLYGKIGARGRADATAYALTRELV
ncbi:MAG: alpha/beta fold hydrolase [Thermomicrobiales bacterium]